MRDIRFRGWDKKEKRWWTHEETLSLLLLQGRVLNKTAEDKEGLLDRFEVVEFTGLHDKNGREIYEGNIVSIKGHTYEDNFAGTVIYKSGGFWVGRDFMGNWKEYMLEVIGNIYQNPELLEGV